MMYLSDGDRLLIIAGCLGFVALCFLIMVCKLSPFCCLHKYCPLRPKYKHGLRLNAGNVAHYDSTSETDPVTLRTIKVHRAYPLSPGDSTSSETEDGYSTVEEDRDHHRTTEDAKKEHVHFSSAVEPLCLVKGELQLAVYYDESDDSRIRVRIHKINNLIFRRRNRVKICVKIQLLKKEDHLHRFLKFFQFSDPEEQATNIEYETHTSMKAIHKTKLLEWEEIKLIPVPRSGCEDRCLRFVCCLYDKYSQCTNLGEAMVFINEVSLDENDIVHRPLTATHQETKGEMLLSLSYLPTAQKLIVLPVECRQLKLLHTRFSSSVFIRVALMSKGTYTKKKTRLKESQSRILWNEPVNFDLPNQQIGDVSVVVTVKQSVAYPDRVRDKNIGKLILGMVTGSDKAQQHWKEMLENPRQPQAIWHSII